MSRKSKLLDKARNSPRNISFPELTTLASAYGLFLKPGKAGGSHYLMRLPDGTKSTIVREGNTVKEWYVKEVVEAIEIFCHEQI